MGGFCEHIWCRLMWRNSWSYTVQFLLPKVTRSCPQVIQKEHTYTYLCRLLCVSERVFSHMYAQNNTHKVYTLQTETFSLSEVGIIRRHLKSTLAAVSSTVCFNGCTVFVQNYTSTVRVKELDKRIWSSFDIFTVILLDVTVVLQRLPWCSSCHCWMYITIFFLTRMCLINTVEHIFKTLQISPSDVGHMWTNRDEYNKELTEFPVCHLCAFTC